MLKIFPLKVRKMLQKIFYWKYLVFNTILLSHLNFSQELNCKVSVNYSLVNQTESNVFNDLEKNINVFLNEKKWTNDSYKDYEKINCSFLITILDYSDNSFSANIEVNSFRPVFNSNYNSKNFLFKDNGVTFSYEINQSILFSETRYESDLSSLLGFYSLIIIGYDKDTFSKYAGTNQYNLAKKILDYSSSFSNSQMWSPSHNGGRINKFWLIDNLISTNYQSIREVNYNYHLNGLDLLINNDTLAKTNIIDALLNFEQINRFRPNSLLQQIFFQSKNDEIFNLFLKHQNKMEIEEIKNLLNVLSPFYSNNWSKL